MVKMKILSSLTVLQVQLISQPLQKQQMPDSRKRQKKQRNSNFPQRKKRVRFLI